LKRAKGKRKTIRQKRRKKKCKGEPFKKQGAQKMGGGGQGERIGPRRERETVFQKKRTCEPRGKRGFIFGGKFKNKKTLRKKGSGSTLVNGTETESNGVGTH